MIWVLQSAFRELWHTTFFHKNEADFRPPPKRDHRRGRRSRIMKRGFSCLGAAIEACATKEGTMRWPPDERACRLLTS